jgi:serine/threonine protein kinase
LNHPYIVRLYEGQLHLGKVPYGYIALEYFQGTNLEDAVALQGPFPWYVVLPIMQQILLALDHMHQQKILHRDIKPGNILFHPAYSVAKIIDLGLTKCFSASQQPVLFTTRTNVALGTPDFMPIEQWHNAKGVDHRADIYALGATLYYVLTGEVPYGDHSSIEELFKAMSQHKRIPLKKHCSSDVPLALIEIIEKMLAFDPVARYQTCQEVLEDFEKVPYSPSLFRTQNNLK